MTAQNIDLFSVSYANILFSLCWLVEFGLASVCFICILCFNKKYLIPTFECHCWMRSVLISAFFEVLYMCHNSYNFTSKLLNSNMRLMVTW